MRVTRQMGVFRQPLENLEHIPILRMIGHDRLNGSRGSQDFCDAFIFYFVKDIGEAFKIGEFCVKYFISHPLTLFFGITD